MSFTSNSHNSGKFHSNEKNKISESKLESHLSKTKNNFRNQTKGFQLLLIKCRTFLGTWCIFVILTWLFGDHGLAYFIFWLLTANRKFHENQQNAGHQVNEIRVPRLWFVNK